MRARSRPRGHASPAWRRALAIEIEGIAREAGVEIVGFGDVQSALPADFHHLPVGISLGVVHPAVRSLQLLPEGRPTAEIERALCDHRDRHGQVVLEKALRDLADYLRSRGYRYFCCPPEVDPMESPFTALMVRRFSHKAAATCAGVGWVGRHGLLNHPAYGPHVTFATLVTNAPLDPAEPVVRSECGTCRSCVDACPAGAITGRPWSRDDGMVSLVDADRCRRVLAENARTTGRWFCGRCALACAGARRNAGERTQGGPPAGEWPVGDGASSRQK